MECDREGWFRATPISKGITVADQSDAVAITINLRLTHMWDDVSKEPCWKEWAEWAMEARGDFWIVGRNGEFREKKVAEIARATGWDGNLDRMTDESDWEPRPCVIQVKRDDYGETSRFRVSWLFPADKVPGARAGNANAEQIGRLHQRYRGKLKAAAGNSSVPAPGTRLPPSTPRTKPPQQPPAEQVGVALPKDDLPF